MKQRLLDRLREEMEMKLKGGLYHLTQIKLAYNSNRIEGSRLSEDQTRYIFETNTLNLEPDEAANVDDIIERSIFFCFDYMLANADEELSQEMIKNSRFSTQHSDNARVGTVSGTTKQDRMLWETLKPRYLQMSQARLENFSSIIIIKGIQSKILLPSITGLKGFILSRMAMDGLVELLCLRNA